MELSTAELSLQMNFGSCKIVPQYFNCRKRLGAKVGEGCEILHERLMIDLRVNRIEMDEVWSFVGKKKKNVKDSDPDTVGEQFIYIAIDATSKAILAWFIGKRDTRNTIQFVKNVKRRILGNPEISTDGYAPYIRAIDEVFEGTANHGIVDKVTVYTAFGPDKLRAGARSSLVEVNRKVISGNPNTISTSYIERQNLTLRMSQRRFTRLTNGFSKKFENHCAAISLYAAHFNFCRIHEALRITPAMHLGIADHIWSIGELITSSLTGEVKMASTWQVISGGKPR